MSKNKIFSLIEDIQAKFIDFRFTDTGGKNHHITYSCDCLDKDLIKNGVMFDGSSIKGWKGINESDMILMPDAETACEDPFSAYPTVIVYCDVLEPSTGKAYSRDPRTTAKKAEEYLKYSGVGDTAYFGPELEFFCFDDVKFGQTPTSCFYKLTSEEDPQMSSQDINGGNTGHRPTTKGGYFPVSPIDSTADLRCEMIENLNAIGLTAELHHHEVAPSQNEIGFKFSTLVDTADNVQRYKYVVQNTAHAYGKSVTFMPKPVHNDNGTGMHTHQSIWKDGKPVFAGNGYADLSETCLYYIGGIIKHAKAINAFANASTNSYKRLVPGYEAPVLLAYSSRNRSASIRIPYVSSSKAKRIEVRFPDPTANPYLAFSAMLMAGLDGIENKIHPGEAMDKNLYDLPAEELKDVPAVASNLREALQALDKDRDFLKKGDVMTDDQIDAYISLKMEEIDAVEQSPHPAEFKLYYSV